MVNFKETKGYVDSYKVDRKLFMLSIGNHVTQEYDQFYLCMPIKVKMRGIKFKRLAVLLQYMQIHSFGVLSGMQKLTVI